MKDDSFHLSILPSSAYQPCLPYMVARWLQKLQESHPYTGSKELGLSSGEEKRRKFFSEVLPADSLGPIGEKWVTCLWPTCQSLGK